MSTNYMSKRCPRIKLIECIHGKHTGPRATVALPKALGVLTIVIVVIVARLYGVNCGVRPEQVKNELVLLIAEELFQIDTEFCIPWPPDGFDFFHNVNVGIRPDDPGDAPVRAEDALIDGCCQGEAPEDILDAPPYIVAILLPISLCARPMKTGISVALVGTVNGLEFMIASK